MGVAVEAYTARIQWEGREQHNDTQFSDRTIEWDVTAEIHMKLNEITRNINHTKDA